MKNKVTDRIRAIQVHPDGSKYFADLDIGTKAKNVSYVTDNSSKTLDEVITDINTQMNSFTGYLSCTKTHEQLSPLNSLNPFYDFIGGPSSLCLNDLNKDTNNLNLSSIQGFPLFLKKDKMVSVSCTLDKETDNAIDKYFKEKGTDEGKILNCGFIYAMNDETQEGFFVEVTYEHLNFYTGNRNSTEAKTKPFLKMYSVEHKLYINKFLKLILSVDKSGQIHLIMETDKTQLKDPNDPKVEKRYKITEEKGQPTYNYAPDKDESNRENIVMEDIVETYSGNETDVKEADKKGQFETNDITHHKVEAYTSNGAMPIYVKDPYQVVYHCETSLYGLFKCTIDSMWVGLYEQLGTPFVSALSPLSNIKLSATAEELRKPIWLIGDSYYGMMDIRIGGQLSELGYGKNICMTGKNGLNSANGLAEIQRCLNFAKPKFLIWGLGLNDNFEKTVGNTGRYEYDIKLEALINICKENNIHLYLTTLPPAKGLHPHAAYIANQYITKYVNQNANTFPIGIIDLYSAVCPIPVDELKPGSTKEKNAASWWKYKTRVDAEGNPLDNPLNDPSNKEYIYYPKWYDEYDDGPYSDFNTTPDAEKRITIHNGPIHPTYKGSTAMAMQILIDCPEILEYGCDVPADLKVRRLDTSALFSDYISALNRGLNLHAKNIIATDSINTHWLSQVQREEPASYRIKKYDDSDSTKEKWTWIYHWDNENDEFEQERYKLYLYANRIETYEMQSYIYIDTPKIGALEYTEESYEKIPEGYTLPLPSSKKILKEPTSFTISIPKLKVEYSFEAPTVAAQA